MMLSADLPANLFERCRKPKMLKFGRVQPMREIVNVLCEFLQLSKRFLQLLSNGVAGSGFVLDNVEADGKQRQTLSDVIVQFSRETLALLFRHMD